MWRSFALILCGEFALCVALTEFQAGDCCLLLLVECSPLVYHICFLLLYAGICTIIGGRKHSTRDWPWVSLYSLLSPPLYVGLEEFATQVMSSLSSKLRATFHMVTFPNPSNHLYALHFSWSPYPAYMCITGLLYLLCLGMCCCWIGILRWMLVDKWFWWCWNQSHVLA